MYRYRSNSGFSRSACRAPDQGARKPQWGRQQNRRAELPGHRGRIRARDVESFLAGKIKSGGQGSWGAIQMPAQTLSDGDARLLAQWLATGAKKWMAPFGFTRTSPSAAFVTLDA